VTVKVEGGEEYLALVKDLQVDPVKQVALHVDFQRVRADVAVQTEVEVRLVGDAPGVKTGGILDQTMRMVAIEALPHALPEAIELDVSDMELGDVKRISDLVAPAGVTILTDPEESIASVVAPKVAEPELTPEQAEALAGLSAEELEALKEFAAAAPAAAAEAPAEDAGEGEGGEPSEAPEGE
jgi:large subunit ribosomal protein L25